MTKAFRGAALALACLANAGLAAAQPADAAKNPWYMVLGLGSTAIESEYAQTAGAIGRTGATAFTTGPYGNTNLWRMHFGYRLSPRFSVEGGYWSFGDTRYTTTVTAPVAAAFSRQLRISGLSADLVYSHPLSGSFSALAKAGILFSRVKAGAIDPGPGLTPVPADLVRSRDLHLGAGIKYQINRSFDVRVEYDWMRKVGDRDRVGTFDIMAFSAALGYDF